MAIAGTAPATVAGQGQSLPPAMKLEQDVVSWTESLYSQATEDKDREREIKDSLKIIDYLEGKQWADKARFARSRPVINKFQRHFWESVGLLTDLALDFNVKLFDKLNDYCYDAETEILTRERGFVLFKDLLQTDFVATRSSTGEFQWQKPSVIMNKHYSGVMYQFAAKGINLKVTPKHRMLISRKRKAGWVEEVTTAETFARGLNSSRKIPVTSLWRGEEIGEKHFPRTFRTGKDICISGDDFCALLGAYIAEGSICKQGGIAVSQLKTSKGYTEYKELFDRLGGEYNGRQFVLHPRALTEYFKQFGHAHEKFVPEIIRNATPRQIAIFLHFYGLGDGCFRLKRNVSGRGKQPRIAPHYTTVSHKLADQLVEMVQKTGYSAALYVRPAYKQAFCVKGVHGKVYEYVCDCRESYVITTRHSQQMGVKVEAVNYKGTIHCVTVPNGIVYVRRNGKPSWCGNSEFEHILNELAVHWAENNSFEDRLYDVVLYGLLHSGYAKLQWNSSLNGGMGDVDLIPIAPWNIAFVGGNGQNLQQCEANIYFHVVTLEHLYRTFGETARRVKGDSEYSGEGSFGGTSASLRPAHISKESWARIQGSPLQKILAGSATPEDATQYPMVMQKEFWIKDASINERSEPIVVGNPLSNWSYLVEPGMALYPRGRVITTAGGCVLGDDPNPYWHARFPFSAFKPYRVPWKVSGVSPTKPWIQMSNIMNRIYGGLLDQVNSIIEPSLIAPKAAFPAADWDSLDPGASGAKIKYNNNSPRPPEFAKKADLPSYIFTYLQEISKEYEMSSSASAVGQALSKKQVPGGDAIEQIISSRSFPMKVQSRGLTSFIKDIGYMGISDMLQFYSVAHRQAILGTKGITDSDFRPIYGQARPSGMKGEDFVRKFQFIIKPGSTLAVEKDDKIKYAFALSKLGKLSDRGLYRQLDQNFDFNRNQKELLEEAKIKLLVAGAAAAVTGKGGKK